MFIKNYQQLSPEEKNFLNTGIIEAEKTSKEWIQIFDNLANINEQLENVRITSYRIVFAGFIAICVSMLFCFLSGYLGLVVFLFAVFSIPIGSIIYYKTVKINLPDSTLKEMLKPLISDLQPNLRSGATIYLNLDLRGFLHKEKLLDTENSSKKLSKKETHVIQTDSIKDKWCEGRATIEDETTIYWTITDFIEHWVKKEHISFRLNKQNGTKTTTFIKDKSSSIIEIKTSVDEKKVDLTSKQNQNEESVKIYTEKKEGKHWLVISKEFKHYIETYEIPQSSNPFDAIIRILLGESKIPGVQNFNKHGEYGFLKPTDFMDIVTEIFLFAASNTKN